MRNHPSRPRAVFALALLLAALSCELDPTPPSGVGPGELELTIASTGMITDPNGYVVLIDGVNPTPVSANGTTVFTLPHGQHEIRLTDLSGTCQASQDTWIKFIVGGSRSQLTIDVACPAPGQMIVNTGTTGVDSDQDGYLLTLDGVLRGEIGRDGSTTIDGLRPGLTRLELRGVAGNCVVEGGASRELSVVEAGTLSVELDVSCTSRPIYPAGEYIVVSSRRDFASDFDLHLLAGNGTHLEKLTDHPDHDLAPTISPAGDRIAFLRFGVNSSDPAQLMLLDRISRSERLHPQRTNYAANWSPDGNRLVINVGGSLMISNVDGSGEDHLADFTVREGYWSPDGTRIAFTRGTLTESNVAVINTDGTNIRFLTTKGWRQASPWSPRSSLLLIQVGSAPACAFQGWPSPCGYSELELATLDPSTGAEVVVGTPYVEFRPTWSPAGERILFIAYDGGMADLYSLRLDDSVTTNLTRSSDIEEWFSVGRFR